MIEKECEQLPDMNESTEHEPDPKGAKKGLLRRVLARQASFLADRRNARRRKGGDDDQRK